MKRPLKVKLIFSYWKRLLKGNFYEDLEKEQRKETLEDTTEVY
jgi:hypothetical protein